MWIYSITLDQALAGSRDRTLILLSTNAQKAHQVIWFWIPILPHYPLPSLIYLHFYFHSRLLVEWMMLVYLEEPCHFLLYHGSKCLHFLDTTSHTSHHWRTNYDPIGTEFCQIWLLTKSQKSIGRNGIATKLYNVPESLWQHIQYFHHVWQLAEKGLESIQGSHSQHSAVTPRVPSSLTRVQAGPRAVCNLNE